MTDHGIEELKRQYEQDISRANDANQRCREAHRRLEEALIKAADERFAAIGITIGSRVIGTPSYGDKKIVRGVFVGHRGSWMGAPLAVPIVKKMKKDGTASKMRAYGENWRAAED